MRAPLVDDITELMRVLGREPRPVILRSGLRRLPQATTLDATINLWTLEPVDQVVDLGDYLEPTTWRVGLNRLAKPPELGATWNSYWSASGFSSSRGKYSFTDIRQNSCYAHLWRS